MVLEHYTPFILVLVSEVVLLGKNWLLQIIHHTNLSSCVQQTVRSSQLIQLGNEICSGMDYIAAKQIVLRNLAAKNCM